MPARMVMESTLHMGNVTEVRNVIANNAAEVTNAFKHGVLKVTDQIKNKMAVDVDAHALIAYYVGELAAEMAKGSLEAYGQGTDMDVHVVTGSLMDAVQSGAINRVPQRAGKKQASANIRVVINKDARRHDKPEADSILHGKGIHTGELVSSYYRLDEFIDGVPRATMDAQEILLDSLRGNKAIALIKIEGKDPKGKGVSLASILMSLQGKIEQLRLENRLKYMQSISAREKAQANR